MISNYRRGQGSKRFNVSRRRQDQNLKFIKGEMWTLHVSDLDQAAPSTKLRVLVEDVHSTVHQPDTGQW
jgi:hypothetical protein